MTEGDVLMLQQKLIDDTKRIILSYVTLDKMAEECASSGFAPHVIVKCRRKIKDTISETTLLINAINDHLTKISEESVFFKTCTETINQLLEAEIAQMQFSLNLKRNERAIKNGTK